MRVKDITMSFDPCGTRTLDGEEIIKRLAAYLGITVESLKEKLSK